MKKMVVRVLGSALASMLMFGSIGATALASDYSAILSSDSSSISSSENDDISSTDISDAVGNDAEIVFPELESQAGSSLGDEDVDVDADKEADADADTYADVEEESVQVLNDKYTGLEAYEYFNSLDYIDGYEDNLFAASSYNSDQPIVNRFEVSWQGHDPIDLLDTASFDGTGLEAKTAVDLSAYDGKKPLEFIVGFDNASSVGSVDVIGMIGGQQYSMSAEKLSGSKLFKAKGYFNEGSNNQNLTSVSLKLKSNRVISPVSRNNSAITVNEEAVDRIRRYNEMCGNVTVSHNGTSTAISVDYEDYYSTTYKKIFNESIGVLVEEMDPTISTIEDLAKQGKRTIECLTTSDEGGQYRILFDTSDSKNIYAYFEDLAKPASTIMKYTVSLQDEKGIYNSLSDFSAEFSDFLKITHTLSDYKEYNDEYDEYVRQINASNIRDKNTAIKKAAELKESKQFYSAVTNLIAPLVVACCEGLPGGIGISLLVTGAKTFMDCAAEHLWEARAKDILGDSMDITNENADYGDSYGSYIYNEYDENGNVVKVVRLYGSKASGYTMELWGEEVYAGAYYHFSIPGTDNSLYPEAYSNYITKLIFDPGVKKAHAAYGSTVEEIVLSNTVQEFGGAGKKLKKINIPRSLKKIYNGAFSKSTLQNIDLSSVEEIGERAFEEASISGTLVIPETCKKIGKLAFYHCNNIEKVVIEGNPASKKAIEIEERAFESCSKLKSIVIEGNVEKLININGQTILNELVIKGNVNCLTNDNPRQHSIDKIYILGRILDYEDIYINSWFYYLDECNDFYYGGTKEEILALGLYFSSSTRCHYGYDYETGKEHVVKSGKCGANLKYEIYQVDGNSDDSLLKRYDLHITGTGDMYDYELSSFDGSVRYTGNAPWSGYYLSRVYLSNGITGIGDNAGLFGDTIEIPSTVKKIGKYAFYGNAYNGILIIPDSVVEIGDYAFAHSKIKNVYIGKGLKKIPDSCFDYCSKMSGRIIIPENITEIGSNAFRKVADEKNRQVSLQIKGNNLRIVGGFAFSQCPYLKFVDSYFISNLTSIGDWAFKDCEGLVGYLRFSDEIKDIGYWAFKNCTGIKSVYFGKAPKSLSNTFVDCSGLTSAVIKSGEVDLEGTFKNCTGLKTLELNEGVTSIGRYTFKNCINLQSDLIIPSTVEYIWHQAFYNCSSLKSVQFKDGVEGIWDRAFKNCTGLKGDLVLPPSLRTVGTEAFMNCTGLDGNLVFPQKSYRGMNLEPGAFENCSNITGTVELAAFQLGTDNEWQRVFYGMNKVDQFLLKDIWDSGPFVEKGKTGNYLGDDEGQFYDPNEDEYEISYADVDLSTFPENAKLKCVKKSTYEKFKDLGYDIEDVSGEYAGYKLTYNTNGHGYSWSVADQMTIPAALVQISATGYTFGGWYKTSECRSGEEVVPGTKLKGDTIIYAKWTANSYKVTFDAGVGQIVKGEAARSVTYDTAYGELPVAEFEENTFLGWFTSRENGTLVTAESRVTTAADHTLYAIYKYMPKVLAPTAGDASGKELSSELIRGTKIYLFTSTNDADIYYTTNPTEAGNIPEDEEHLYDTAIVFDEDITIYAKAVKKGYRNSDVIAFSFKVLDTSQIWGDVTEEDRVEKGYANADAIPEGLWISGVRDMPYTGKAITQNLRVYNHKILLTLNKDYTITYKNNVKAGTALVTVTGKGSYSGAVKLNYTITPIDISGEEFRANDILVAYNKKGQKPAVDLFQGNKKLTANTDYTVSWINEKNKTNAAFVEAGDYEITINGKGNYTGTRTLVYRITQNKLISKVALKAIAAQNYKGEPIRPAIILSDGKYKLEENTDYIVTWPEDCTSVGKVSVTIEGIGKYEGTRTVTYAITGIPLSKATITGFKTSFGYTGDAITQSDVKLAYGKKTLTEDIDYTVSYSNNVNIGTATVLYTGIGGYTGVVKKTYKIAGTAINTAAVAGIAASYAYDGNLQTPAGTEDSLDSNGVTVTYTYVVTRNKVKTKEKIELIKGTDYVVSYKNNLKVGTASVVFKGIGKYTGTITKTFKITAYNINKDTEAYMEVKCDESVPYVKNGCKPPVTVLFRGEELKKGVDYTVTYANNNAITTEATKKLPSIVIKGKGNFAGTYKTINFNIVRQDISLMNISVADKVFANKAKAYVSAPVIKDVNNPAAKLEAGKDYNKAVTYKYAEDTVVTQVIARKTVTVTRERETIVENADIVPVGAVIKAEVFGSGCYEGTITGYYKVIKADISQAVVKVNAQTYTGDEIVIDKKDVTSITIGKTKLTSKDYDIIGYKNNVKAGNATMTIKGKGNYGGVKNVTFRIVTKSF